MAVSHALPMLMKVAIGTIQFNVFKKSKPSIAFKKAEKGDCGSRDSSPWKNDMTIPARVLKMDVKTVIVSPPDKCPGFTD